MFQRVGPIEHEQPSMALALRGRAPARKEPERGAELARVSVVEQAQPECAELLTLPPPIVLAPIESLSAAGPPVAGSGLERAQVAALAERLLTSFRIGRREGQQEIRLVLGTASRFEGAEVRLRQEERRVVATIVKGQGDVRELAAALESSLGPGAVTVE